MVLYANAYGSRIDWMQILTNCREIHAEKFATAILQIGSERIELMKEYGILK